MELPDDPICEYEAADPQELIDILRLVRRGSDDHPSRPYDWAFRGQADASWKLVPKALRVGTKLGFYANRRQFTSRGEGGSLDQLNGELVAVRQFVERTDRVGLPLPYVDPLLRQDGFDHSFFGTAAVGGKIGTAEWPKPQMLELLAIAQHHGVPTRLLDFSFDPLVALYFAARGITADSSEQDQRLAVWCLNLKQLYTRSSTFAVVEVERSKNPFLRSQKGLFVLDKRLGHANEREKTASMDERVDQLFGDSKTGRVMVKTTLAVDHAQEVLRLLSDEGIDFPHLMPTYDNVVAHLNTEGS